ncbi:MAG: hypothetical protein J5J06_20155 [Phycisphaerae bacterium]|nr:hypothetical protein [Phycisphaerae bacterium]
MKGVFGLMAGLALLAFLGASWLSRESMRDHGRAIAVAFGAPHDGKIEVHLGVPPGVIIVDPPDRDQEKRMTWNEWIDAHYKLQKKDGTPVRLKKMGTSGLFVGEPAGGAPEFCVMGEIEQGQDYAFDFKPKMHEKNVYRYEFTAPTEEVKVSRPNFELVTE